MHVIGDKQAFCHVVKTGPAGEALNSSFTQRNSEIYKRELGQSILQVCTIVPEGILVFFPSYPVMDASIEFWKRRAAGDKSIYEQIAQFKVPSIEPKAKGELPAVMDSYYRSIPNGAIFFAVCRGKVSEGLDFSDGKARAVIITGIPYPPLKDPKVILKRQYLDDLIKNKKSKEIILTGDEWYSQQAARAVNQAIGRVIRHRHDYGAVLLFDDRFAGRAANQLSKWLRPYVRVSNSFGEMKTMLTRFFTDKQAIDDTKRLCEEQQQAIKPASIIFQNLDKARETFDAARSFFRNIDPVEQKLILNEPLKSTIPVPLKRDIKKDPVSRDPELHQAAQNYLAKVKDRLDTDAMRTFTLLLKSFRAKQIEIGELLDRVNRHFEIHDCMNLLLGLRDFLPKKHHPLFDETFVPSKGTDEANNDLMDKEQLSGGHERKRPFDQINSPKKIEPLDLSLAASTSIPITLPCPICKELVTNGYKAKCGHVCCLSCWSTWLQMKLECPLCRVRTRLPQLRRVIG
jgi:hypothetical protein